MNGATLVPEEARRSTTWYSLCGANAFVLASFFLFLEVVKAHRSSQWAGWAWGDGLGLALGFLAYFLVFLAAALVTFVLCKLLLGKRGLGICRAAAVAVPGMLVWGALSPYREFAPTSDDGLVAAVLFVLAMAPGILGLLVRGWSRYFPLWLGVSFLGGAAASWSGTYYALFMDGRVWWATYPALAWVSVCGALGLLLWPWPGGMGKGLRLTHALLCVLAPAFAVWAATLPVPSRGEGASKPPSMVLYISDSLSAKYMGHLGGGLQTPHLDALAGESVVFEQAYALGPWTMPSVSGLFSGEYPPSLTPGTEGDGWLDELWRYRVNPDTLALPVRLQEQGYATGAFVSNALLWTMPHLLEGFDTVGRAHPMVIVRAGLFRGMPFMAEFLGAWAPPLAPLRANDCTAALDYYVRAWLRRHRNEPFFLYIHQIDPHAPYDPPQRFRTMEGPWPLFYPYPGGEVWDVPQVSKDFYLPPEHRPYVRSLYEGEVRYIDESVGRLMRLLRQRRMLDETYVCFTSDHGEELWEHGKWGHGQSVYEELVHVPLLVRGPDLASRRIAAPFSAIHLMPTLADLLGLSPKSPVPGRSAAALLRGSQRDWPEEPVFVQGTSNKAYPHPHQGVRHGDYKYMRAVGGDMEQLFNLESDAGESNDLSAARKDELRALADSLAAWLESFPWHFGLRDKSGDGVGEEMMERLEGMGYL